MSVERNKHQTLFQKNEQKQNRNRITFTRIKINQLVQNEYNWSVFVFVCVHNLYLDEFISLYIKKSVRTWINRAGPNKLFE